jgi:hypothetical protein
MAATVADHDGTARPASNAASIPWTFHRTAVARGGHPRLYLPHERHGWPGTKDMDGRDELGHDDEKVPAAVT